MQVKITMHKSFNYWIGLDIEHYVEGETYNLDEYDAAIIQRLDRGTVHTYENQHQGY